MSESFSCKWTIIKEAILNAMGREHNITKVDNFIDKDGTDFYGFPLEILFGQIDYYVDEVLGTDLSSFQDEKYRTISDYTFSTKWKYILIMRLVRSLSGQFSNVKKHIRQEVADIIIDIKKLVDINDFSDKLKTHFKDIGHLQQFTTLVVQPPNKKNLSANKTGVEDKSKEEDPEKKKEFSEKFSKTRVHPKVEKEFKQGLIDTLSKLCNESNSATQIGSLQEYKDFCRKNKNTACFNCISLNCFAKQKASKEAKIKRIFNKNCSKKHLTLGEVKALANKSDTQKKDEGTSVGATATVTTPTTEHLEEINTILNDYPEDEEVDASYSQNMADVQLNHNITEGKLQTRMHYWSSKDPKAMDSDKKCIVCGKRNMSWPRYQSHLENHNLVMMEDSFEYLDIEQVIYAWETWMEEDTPSPNPRLYDSVNECEISDFESTSEEDNDEEEPPKLMSLPTKSKRRISSST